MSLDTVLLSFNSAGSTCNPEAAEGASAGALSGGGGALALLSCAAAALTRVTMANNIALFGDGGALLASGVGNLTVSAASLRQNGAWLNGGAVASNNSSMAIRGSALDGNAAGVLTDWVADPAQRARLCAPAPPPPPPHPLTPACSRFSFARALPAIFPHPLCTPWHRLRRPRRCLPPAGSPSSLTSPAQGGSLAAGLGGALWLGPGARTQVRTRSAI